MSKKLALALILAFAGNFVESGIIHLKNEQDIYIDPKKFILGLQNLDITNNNNLHDEDILHIIYPQLCSRYIRMIAYLTNSLKPTVLERDFGIDLLNKGIQVLKDELRGNREAPLELLESCLELKSFPELDEHADIVDELAQGADKPHFSLVDVSELAQEIMMITQEYVNKFLLHTPEVCSRYIKLVAQTSVPSSEVDSDKIYEPEVGKQYLEQAQTVLHHINEEIGGSDNLNGMIVNFELCKKHENFPSLNRLERQRQRETLVV